MEITTINMSVYLEKLKKLDQLSRQLLTKKIDDVEPLLHKTFAQLVQDQEVIVLAGDGNMYSQRSLEHYSYDPLQFPKDAIGNINKHKDSEQLYPRQNITLFPIDSFHEDKDIDESIDRLEHALTY